MSIRQGVYRIGETVEISISFTDKNGQPMSPTGIKLHLLKPDEALDTIDLTVTDNAVAVDVVANMVGTWKIRVEWETPTKGAKEDRFEVVASTVLQPS